MSWTITATDAAGNTATCSATLTAKDVTAPTISCPAHITTGTDAGSCSKTLTALQIGTPTSSDNCSSTISWTRSDGAATLIAPYQFGTTTIKWTATDAAGNTAICNQLICINKVNTLTTFAVSTTPSSSPVTQQYSDRVTFVATVTPFNCGSAGFNWWSSGNRNCNIQDRNAGNGEQRQLHQMAQPLLQMSSCLSQVSQRLHRRQDHWDQYRMQVLQKPLLLNLAERMRITM
jgi:hypothetical protein